MEVKNTVPKLRIKSAIVCASIGLLLSNNAFAQQDPYYTHYNFVRQMYNPAVVGYDGKWCAYGISHSQYVGLQDRTPEYTTPNNSISGPVGGMGPRTNGLGIAAPLGKFNRELGESKNFGGVGLVAYTDNLGYEKNTVIRGQFAYRKVFASGNTLAFGADVGFHTKSLNGSQLRAIDANDPFIPSGTVSDGKLTTTFGAFYTNKNFNNLHIGLSSTNLAPQTYSYGDNGLVKTQTARHYYLLGAMQFDNFLGNPSLALHPSVLLKYNSVLQADANALVEYMETFSGGLGYRSITDALSLMIGYKVKGIRIGYSYDITLSRLQRVSNGTHEICINYCWIITPPPPPPVIPILSPRTLDRENSRW